MLAVFATMYVRDHQRPEMHAAMGLDPTAYDFDVFRITSEITKQVFPLTLDLDDPRFRAGLERLRRISVATEAAAKARGGAGRRRQARRLRRRRPAPTFARLYCLPAQPQRRCRTTCASRPTW